MTVLTREVSPRLSECELTHRRRVPIDATLARRQHGAYEEVLRKAGLRVERVASTPELADGVFVEDTALVLPEVAVILRPGAAPRRSETPSVARVLERYRDLRHVHAPGTVDGGDILRLSNTLFVGASSRTNTGGIRQLEAIVREFGYDVKEVGISGCLHLKSAVTQVGQGILVANRRWLREAPFRGWEIIDVDPREPSGGNALWINRRVIYPAAFPRTAERLRERGVRMDLVDISELQRAEAGVTCCCVPLWTEPDT